MTNENALITIQHLKQLAETIVKELSSLENIDEQIGERLIAIEEITGIDFGEITAG